MPTVRSRWKAKLSSFHSPFSSSSSSSSSSPNSKIIDPPPPEFVCPISSSLMADPVILPSGHSFDRPFIEACRYFSFPPPSAPNLDFSSPNFLLIPNVALKSAILNWCSRSAFPPPIPVSSDTARDLVAALMTSSSSSLSSSNTTNTVLSPESMKSCNSGEIITMTSELETEIREDPLVEEIVRGLKHAQISIRESSLINLRQLSRETKEKQIALCTPKLLSALLPFLLSRNPSLQTNAVASLVNLSIEPSNKIKIVRSGAVPPLVDVLKNGDPDARDHAAGAVFSLALEEENRLAIGVLGAVPPLVHLFYQENASHLARKEAGMAIYYLTLAANNAAKLAKTAGATRAVLRIATEKGGREAMELRRVAMMIVGNLAGRPEGRVGLMDAGAVGMVVGMMKEGAGREEEHCIGILYGLSRGSLRFRALAKAAGAEEVLKEVTGNGEIGKEMVRRVLRMVRGEEEGGVVAILGDEDGEVGTVVSEGLASFRRRYEDFGSGSGHGSGSGSHSTGF